MLHKIQPTLKRIKTRFKRELPYAVYMCMHNKKTRLKRECSIYHANYSASPIVYIGRVIDQPSLYRSIVYHRYTTVVIR